MFFSKSLKNLDDKEYLGKEEYTILKTPNDPLIKYKGLKFSTQADLFIYKNQNYINNNMKWLEIQTFKIYLDKKYSLQCLYIKNANSIDKTQVVLYSQCFYTNLATTLPFLIDLSNYLRINVITYEYNNKEKQDSNLLDVNIIYHYLYKIEFINSIILLGLSIGNKINMDVILSKINLNLNKKLKAFIFISPTWVYDLSILKKLKNFSLIRGDVDQFLLMINQLNIPICIIHGKQDLNVKYFLSLSFSQKIQNKFEWFPKNGTHFDIINEHRTKLLIKLKEFFTKFNLLNKEDTHFDNFVKVNEEEISNNSNNLEERQTAFFNDNKNTNKNDNKNENKKDNKDIIDNKNKININNDEDDYYAHYNNLDIMGSKKKPKKNNKQTDNNNKNKINDNNNELYTVCQSKIKNEDDITINQNIKEYDDITVNKNIKEYDDITVNKNIKEYDDVTLNQNIKEYDDVTLNQNMKDEDIHSINKDYKTCMNITLNQEEINYNNITVNNIIDYDYDNNLNNVTINQDNIEYDVNEMGLNNNNNPRISIVSFIPGDIIPHFKKRKANPNQSFIYRKNSKRHKRNISYVSFY